MLLVTVENYARVIPSYRWDQATGMEFGLFPFAFSEMCLCLFNLKDKVRFSNVSLIVVSPDMFTVSSTEGVFSCCSYRGKTQIMAPLDILFISFSILLHFLPFYIKFYLNRVFQMITLVNSKFTFISF